MPALQLPITELDICIKRGETFDQTLYYEVGTPLAPFDFTGYEILMQIRHRYGSKAVLLQIDNGFDAGGITVVAGGGIRLYIDLLATAALNTSDGKAVYDLKITKDETATRIFQGKVIISPQVSE